VWHTPCFILFVRLRSPKPWRFKLQTILLVSSESSWWVGVHWLGLGLFGATMWKILITEPFSQWKLNKIETENCIGIWGCSWCCWKALGESDLIEFISHFLELRCGRYWFLSGVCCWKFKQIAKLGLEGEISWACALGYTSSTYISE